MAELKYAGNQSLKYENYGARNPIQSCLPYGAPACLMLTARTSVSGTTRATSNAMPAVSVYQHIHVFDMNFKTYLLTKSYKYSKYICIKFVLQHKLRHFSVRYRMKHFFHLSEIFPNSREMPLALGFVPDVQ